MVTKRKTALKKKVRKRSGIKQVGRKMKRILDIKRGSGSEVQVEYFDGAINSTNYATRKVTFPSIASYDGAYIMWFGKKKIVESLYL